jgi:hypothetical protein
MSAGSGIEWTEVHCTRTSRGFAVIRIDEHEHRRRAACGLTAVLSVPMLDRLLNLPLHEYVSWSDLTATELKMLRKAPAGVVEFTPSGVRRVVTPVDDVDLMIVSTSSWRSGLRKAGSFAPFSRRLLLLPRAPKDLRARLWEADFFGIGVGVGTVTGFDEVLAPAPWSRHYFRAAGWLFRENAYAAWLTDQSAKRKDTE